MNKLSQDQLDALSRPLPPEALKAHPTKKDSSGTPMTTIKAIYVIDRLNEAFGVGGWNLKTTYLNHEKVTRVTQAGKDRIEYISAVHTEFSVPSIGIHLECVAGSTNDDLGDALKGGTTDGITKIASYLGIGADIWRGSQPKAPTKTPAAPAKKTEPVKTEPPLGEPAPAMSPSKSFETPTTLPKGYADELAKINTWEDMLAFKKKCGDELGKSFQDIVKDKMNLHFKSLPKEEQAKAVVKK